jgi:hypothetical protein
VNVCEDRFVQRRLPPICCSGQNSCNGEVDIALKGHVGVLWSTGVSNDEGECGAWVER